MAVTITEIATALGTTPEALGALLQVGELNVSSATVDGFSKLVAGVSSSTNTALAAAAESIATQQAAVATARESLAQGATPAEAKAAAQVAVAACAAALNTLHDALQAASDTLNTFDV